MGETEAAGGGGVMRWNNDKTYVVKDDQVVEVTTKDDDGRWVFFHVCCDCWKVHAVQASIVNGNLQMVFNVPDDEEQVKIHRHIAAGQQAKAAGGGGGGNV